MQANHSFTNLPLYFNLIQANLSFTRLFFILTSALPCCPFPYIQANLGFTKRPLNTYKLTLALPSCSLFQPQLYGAAPFYTYKLTTALQTCPFILTSYKLTLVLPSCSLFQPQLFHTYKLTSALQSYLLIHTCQLKLYRV